MRMIFVSSTFKDMHFERDIIHERVAPELNEYALDFGESVSFCDLRWGVNTGDLENEEGSKKVLSVCLDEIDKCRPYMVIIIGERYGWIPEQKLISEAVENRRDFILEELEMSVTALEIEYGALCHPDKMEHTLIYFREFEGEIPENYQKEGELHAKKLQKLKDRVRKLTNDQIKTYKVYWDSETKTLCGIDSFAAMLAEDIRQLLKKEWDEYQQLGIYERDQKVQWEYAAQKVKQFSARESHIQNYVRLLNSGQKLLVLKGASGSGKSTLMSRLARELQADNEVCLLFAGNTALSSDTLDVLKNMVYFAETKLSWPHMEDLTAQKGEKGQESKKAGTEGLIWADRLAEVIRAYEDTSDKKLIFMLDAVDQLYDDELREKRYFIPADLSEKVQMVISCLDDYDLPYEEEVQQILPLTTENKIEIIGGITRYIGRELESCVVDRIIQKRSSDNPLYLSLLIQRLVMMNKSDFDHIMAHGDGMSAISAHQMQLVEGASDTLEGVGVDILNAASERLGGSLAQKAVMYIALSRYGLREQDLEAILTAEGITWNNLDFSIFVKYMRSLFVLREDGRLDFAHKNIRLGYRNICTDTNMMHHQIVRYLDTLDEKDPIRINEIIYHCIKADDKEYFITYIEKYEDIADISVPAAQVVRQMSLTDEGAWLKQVLQMEKTDHQHLILLFFLNYELDDVFDVTQKELNLERQLYQVMLPVAEQFYINTPDEKSARRLALTYRCLADIYDSLDDAASRKTAREYYEKNLEYRKIVLGFGTSKIADRRQLANAIDCLGDSYAYEEDMASMERGRDLYLEALTIRKELCQEDDALLNRANLARSYKNLSDVYRYFHTAKDYEQSLFYYNEAEGMYEKLVQEKDTYRGRLASVYQDKAALYEELGKKEDLKLALSYYQNNLRLRERLNMENGSAVSRYNLSAAYMNIAGFYVDYGTRDDLKKAEELYKKALAIRTSLHQERQTLASLSNLGACCNNMGKLYMEKGEKEDLVKAKDMYIRYLDISREVAQKKETDDSRKSLAGARKGLADLLSESGTEEEKETMICLYKENIKDREELAEKLKTQRDYCSLATAYINLAQCYDQHNMCREESAQMLQNALNIYESQKKEQLTGAEIYNFSLCYQSLARNYIARDNAADMHQALVYADKACEICEELFARTGTSDAKLALAGALEKTAYIYSELGRIVDAERILAKSIYLQEELVCDHMKRVDRTRLVGAYTNYCILFHQMEDAVISARVHDFMDKLIPLAEDLAAEFGTKQSILNLITSYHAKWAMGIDASSYEAKKASVFWLEKVDAALKQLQVFPDAQERVMDEQYKLKRTYGVYYRTLDGVDNLQTALGYYLDCEKYLSGRNDLYSKRQLTDLYSKIANIYDNLGGSENVTLAVQYQLAQLDVVRAIYAETGLLKDLADLQNSLRVCAIFEVQERNDIKAAIDILEEAVAMGEQHPDKSGLVLTYATMMYCYNSYKDPKMSEKSLKYADAAESLLADIKELSSDGKLELQIKIWDRRVTAYKQSDGIEAQKQSIFYAQKVVDGYARLNEERKTPETRRQLAYSCEQLGSLYLYQEDRKSLQMALTMFDRYEKMITKLWEELKNVQFYRGIAVAYEKKGGVFKAYGGEENYQKALELYQKELAIWEELYQSEQSVDYLNGIAITCHKIGEMYSYLSDSDHNQQALHYYQKEAGHRELLVKLMPIDHHRIKLLSAWENIADTYLYIGGEDNIKKAQDMMLDVLVQREALNDSIHSADTQRDLAVTCENLGDVYYFGYGCECYDQAEQYYRKGMKIWQDLQTELSLVPAKRGLSSIALKAGHCVSGRNTEEGKNEALPYYKIAVDAREELAEAVGTDLWVKSLADAYAFLGQCYELSSYEDRVIGAKEYLGKAIGLYKKLQMESYIKKSANQYSAVLTRLGSIYYKESDEVSQRKALDCIMEAYVILEDLMNTTDQISLKDNYWMCMYMMAKSEYYEESKSELVYKMLPVAEELYAATGNDRHKNFVGFCKYVLKID